MPLTDKAEEILEMLWTETIERNNVPDLTILKDDDAFNYLLDKDYISFDKEKLLTSKGLNEGKLCVRRHRLAERLLVDVLHIKGGQVHEASCKLEHILHKGLEDNICILLGHPKTCPHGRNVPPGPCCGNKKMKPKSLVTSLAELKKGQQAKIAYIHTHDEEMLKKIMAMGALPGLEIKLLQRFPSYVFQIGQSQFAVDKNIASQIQVWVFS